MWQAFALPAADQVVLADDHHHRPPILREQLLCRGAEESKVLCLSQTFQSFLKPLYRLLLKACCKHLLL